MKENQGLIKVVIPLPLWTDHVNCYLLQGEDGWRIIDTGIYTPGTMAIWRKTFLEHGIAPGEIRQILVTHNHMDHLGAAGALQEITGAPVLMSSPDRDAFLEFWDKEAIRIASPHHYFGIPGPLKLEIEQDRIEKYFRWVSPCSDIEELHAGNIVQAGNHIYRVYAFPGHSDGHLCLFNEQNNILLGGDVFVTPNNLVMRCQNPLALFFESMQSLQKMEISRIFPAHGKSFSRVSLRLGLIERYRKGQLARLKKELDGGKTVYELYLSFQQQGAIEEHFFGLGEFYFFLEYLLSKGELTKTKDQGAWRYRLVGKGLCSDACFQDK